MSPQLLWRIVTIGDLALLKAIESLAGPISPIAATELLATAIDATRNSAALVAFLIERGGDPRTRPYGQSLLYWSISMNRKDVTSTLLSSLSKGTDLCRPENVYTAAHANNVPLMITLLDCHSDPNWLEPDSGASALHLAVAQGNRTMIDLLIRAGASCTKGTKSGDTPLDVAAHRHPELSGFISETCEAARP